jgi:hypothetical protein
VVNHGLGVIWLQLWYVPYGTTNHSTDHTRSKPRSADHTVDPVWSIPGQRSMVWQMQIVVGALKIYSLPYLLAITMTPLTTPERPHQAKRDFATLKLPMPNPSVFNLKSCSSRYCANGAKTRSDTSTSLIDSFE